MLAAAGIRHFARCGSTSYRLQWAWLSDPLVSEPAGLIKQYLRALVSNTKLRTMLGKAWHGKRIHNFLASSTRAQWMRVCGPTTALIATLRDLGWAMDAPGQITTEAGELFHMNNLHQQEILHQVAKAAELREQRHAAAQHLGAGMQMGIDISPAKKFIQQLRSSNQHKTAGTATAVVAAGCWFKNRVGTDEPGKLCRICQREEESEQHLFWQCHTDHLVRAGCDKEILEESDHLRRMASDQLANQACLWCRGILPMARLDIPDPAFSNPEAVMEGMDIFVGDVCTDGTGGLHSSNSALRRCAWAAVKPDHTVDSEFWLGVWGPLLGKQQTVPRAELTAIIEVVKRLAGPTTIWTDHKNISDIFNGDLRTSVGRANSDLWEQLLDHLQEKAIPVKVRWVPSHSDEHAEGPAPWIPPLIFLGNAEADRLAGDAVKSQEVENHIAVQVKEQQALAATILNRIVHITEVVLGIGKKEDLQKVRQQRRSMFTEASARGPALKELVYEAKLVTDHQLFGAGRGLHCRKCWTRAPGQQKDLVKWLYHDCETAAEVASPPHFSHSLQAAEPGTIYCISCGAWSTSMHRALLKPCPDEPAKGLGKLALKRFAMGLPPPGANMLSFVKGEFATATDLFIIGLDTGSEGDSQEENEGSLLMQVKKKTKVLTGAGLRRLQSSAQLGNEGVEPIAPEARESWTDLLNRIQLHEGLGPAAQAAEESAPTEVWPSQQDLAQPMDIHDTDSDADFVEVSEGVFDWVRRAHVIAPHPLEQGQAAGSSGSGHWNQQPIIQPLPTADQAEAELGEELRISGDGVQMQPSPLSSRGPVPAIGLSQAAARMRYAIAGRTTYSGEMPPDNPPVEPAERATEAFAASIASGDVLRVASFGIPIGPHGGRGGEQQRVRGASGPFCHHCQQPLDQDSANALASR